MDKEEFKLKKKLLDLEHGYKVEEIELKFQRELEIQRVKSSEIRKTIERKRFQY